MSPHRTQGIPAFSCCPALPDAAEELKEALLINPHDTNEMAKMLDRALKMHRPERWARHRQLMQRIEVGSVTHWRDTFLDALEASDLATIHYRGDHLGAA